MSAPSPTADAAPAVPEVLGDPKSARRAVIAAAVGTTIEWYDYGLFGVAAGLVINPVFFPSQAGLFGLLAATATFAIGYAIRPIGGIIISNLGDRIGRKPTLLLTIILMSVGTVAIGLLPTAVQIGVWAPILLVFFRAVQGFGAGAELTGALTLVAEYYPGKKRGLMTGIAYGSSGLGGVLASLMFLLVQKLPDGGFIEWGWRIPFLASFVLFIVAIWMRLRLEESPEYNEAMRRAAEKGKAVRKVPVLTALRSQPGMVIRGFFIWCGHNCFGYLAITFGVNYLITVAKMDPGQAISISLAASGVFFFASLFWGYISDKVGHRRMLYIYGFLSIIVITPYMLLLQTGQFWFAFLAMVGFGALIASISQGVIGAVTTAMFPSEYRYSALAFGKELNAAIIAGPTPLIATSLLVAGAGAPWYVVGFVVLMAAATLLSMTMRRSTLAAMRARAAADIPADEAVAMPPLAAAQKG